MAVVWGVALPHGPKKKRRASRFQAHVVVGVAERLGPEAIRADGRLFAIRPSLLNGFSWQSDLIVDDTQLAAYVEATGVLHSSECSAVTYIIAARGWRDFYLQTYRSYAVEKLLSTSGMLDFPDARSHGVTARLHDRNLWVQIRAFVREAAADPRGAIAYTTASCACVALHRFAPAGFSDTWPEAKTTKSMNETPSPSIAYLGQGGSVLAAVRVAGEKIAFVFKVVRRCRNSPSVLGAWLANGVPVLRTVAPQDLEIRLHAGPVLRAPNTKLAAWPLLEVLVGDAYHIERLPWRASSEMSMCAVDIGAHVGSFTVALSQRYPRANIICYEPSPHSASYLQVNIAANHLDERVQIYEAAIASKSGSVHLYSNADGSGQASIVGPLDGSDAATQAGIVCPAVAFQAAMSSAGRVDLVKIDCEGAEYDVILNSTSSCWDNVICVLLEYHPVAGHSWGELKEYLTGIGFTIAWRDEAKRLPGLGMAMLVRSSPKASR